MKEIIPEKNKMINHCPKFSGIVWNTVCKNGIYTMLSNISTDMPTDPIKYKFVKGLISNNESFSDLHSNTCIS